MKKLLAILLLCCLNGPLILTILWTNHKRGNIKQEVELKMESGIKESEMVLLKFSIAEIGSLLRWEHSKEFEFRGEMYDIAETTTIGDSVFYACWWDHEETALNNQLDKLLYYAFENDSDSKVRKNKMVDYLKSLYYNSSNNTIIPSSEVEKEFSEITYHIYISFSQSPPYPPPKV